MPPSRTFNWKIGIVPTLTFDTYPFDRQTFTIRLDVGPRGNAFTCNELMTMPGSFLGDLTNAGTLQQMLPTTNEYQLATASGAVTAVHPVNIVNGQSVTDTTKCDITIRASRDATIVFIKVGIWACTHTFWT